MASIQLMCNGVAVKHLVFPLSFPFLSYFWLVPLREQFEDGNLFSYLFVFKSNRTSFLACSFQKAASQISKFASIPFLPLPR